MLGEGRLAWIIAHWAVPPIFANTGLRMLCPEFWQPRRQVPLNHRDCWPRGLEGKPTTSTVIPGLVPGIQRPAVTHATGVTGPHSGLPGERWVPAMTAGMTVVSD
ncbi:protein of unknown function [Candidatus Filomicrobium marinum]|uniref:Uncharacterized protein n=1 Tax=Candidatus Filomicrobium marinum TaxID=1608628 RepID=A0A0D6JIB6_9HYPH|nr:protein of unknown function [Candidatus Filomicrobium marinum]